MVGDGQVQFFILDVGHVGHTGSGTVTACTRQWIYFFDIFSSLSFELEALFS
jgi:hypothetical protein